MEGLSVCLSVTIATQSIVCLCTLCACACALTPACKHFDLLRQMTNQRLVLFLASGGVALAVNVFTEGAERRRVLADAEAPPLLEAGPR